MREMCAKEGNARAPQAPQLLFSQEEPRLPLDLVCELCDAQAQPKRPFTFRFLQCLWERVRESA